MSRSVKKTPIVKDNCKGMKRFASKAARHAKLSNGGMYKKCFESWKIHDWKSNLYRSYSAIGRPRKHWFAPLDAKLLREYYGK